MKKTFLYALKHSFPILIGFLPVGIAYGVLMSDAGYNALWSFGITIAVLAGSLQFLMVTFFAGGVSIVTVAVMALLVNSRHIFYGLPFVEKFREMGGWKYYLIYSLCDENFSMHCSHDFGPEVNEKWAYVFTALLVALYWVASATLGGLVGSLITFDTTGIDFALTALFTTILLDQLRDAGSVLPPVLAAASSAVCLIVFGAANFILPALIMTVVLLVVFRGRIEPKVSEKEAA